MTAHAEETKPSFLTPEDIAAHQKTIDRVQNYLTSLTTLAADFTQVAADGALVTGKFYLKRPGMMRWQYNPPVPVLMIADGHQLVYYDSELQQVSYIPLKSTVIAFLAQDRIRFDGNVGLLAIEDKNAMIRITVAEREKPDAGKLTLEFSDKPLVIRTMVITDSTKQTTTVSLNGARFGAPLNKDLFVFNDPRPSKRYE